MEEVADHLMLDVKLFAGDKFWQLLSKGTQWGVIETFYSTRVSGRGPGSALTLARLNLTANRFLKDKTATFENSGFVL